MDGKRVNTSKSEVMILSQNKVACCVQMRGEQLYQMEQLKQFGVILMKE